MIASDPIESDKAADSPPISFALLLAVCSMIGPFAANTYMPGFTAISQEFDVSMVAVQQTLSVYLITFALASLIVGAISDALGRKTVMMGGILIFLLAALGAAFTKSFELFLWFRIAMGLGAAVGPVLGMAIARDCYQGHAAQKLMSLMAVIFALAPAVSPIIGGWITTNFGWRFIFIFLAALNGAIFLLCALALKESLPLARRQAFCASTLIKNYALAIKNPAFMAGVIAHGFCFMGGILFAAGAADFVLHILKMGVGDFGYLTVPLIIFSMIGSILSPILARRWGELKLIWICIAIMVLAGVMGFFLDFRDNLAYPLIIVFPMLYNFAMAAVRPVLTVLNLDYHPRNRGMAASIQQFMQTLAFAICAAFWIPITMGYAWKYDLVMAFCGVMVGLLWLVVMKTRARCLPAKAPQAAHE